ncbi:MAG: hypothetical protein AAB263_11985 [Planctomycetota bacterium]
MAPSATSQNFLRIEEHYRKTRFVTPDQFPSPPDGPVVHAKKVAPITNFEPLKKLAREVSLRTSDEHVARKFDLVTKFIGGVIFDAATDGIEPEAPENIQLKRHVLQTMNDAGILELVDPRSVRRWARLRFVHETDKEPKPHGRLRIILWPKQLNDESPIFAESAIGDILLGAKMLRRGEKLRTFDMECGFYQLGLSDNAKRYHGIKINGKAYVFTRGTMGGTWTVEACNTVLDTTALAAIVFTGKTTTVRRKTHVDNVGFTGPEDDLDVVVAKFLSLCNEYGLTIREETGEPFLGMHVLVDADGKLTGEVKVADKTVGKFRESFARAAAVDATFADLREFVSRAYYISRILRHPLAEYFTFFKFVRRRYSAFSHKQFAEDDPATIWPCAKTDMKRLYDALMANNPTHHDETAVESDYLLYVDASTRGWGALLFNENTGAVTEVGGAWKRRAESKDIPVLETRAVSLALEALTDKLVAAEGSVLTILTDSTSMRGALVKGNSADLKMNSAVGDALRALAGPWRVQCAWVSSGDNLSDPKSRGDSYFRELASHVGPTLGRRLARSALCVAVPPRCSST